MKACRRCDLFTVVVTERDHRKKMYKGSEDADRKNCCEQQLRRVDKALSRAGDIPEGSWICLSHRNLILAEDKRCSMFLQFLAHAQTFDRGVMRHRARDSGGKFACCAAILVYRLVRDWTRFCYVIGLKNIRIHPSTRYRMRCGFIFFHSGERI